MYWEDLLQALSESAVGTAIMTSGLLFPWLETLHVLAIVTVVGTIAIVDLRLIGFGAHRKSALRLIRELLPYTWLGFALAVVTGVLLFTSNPFSYWESIIFKVKLGLIALAGVNMALFHLTTYRQIINWDEDKVPPGLARMAGLLSLTFGLA